MTFSRTLIAITIIACAFVTSCTTIRITSQPPEAQVILEGDDTPRKTPCSLSIPYFTRPRLKVRKIGFQDCPLPLTMFPSGKHNLVMNRKITIDSMPTGVRVSHQKTLLGTTPLNVLLPANKGIQTYELTDKDYLPYSLKLDPLSSPQRICPEMIPNGPGRYACRIDFTDHGFPHVTQCLDRHSTPQEHRSDAAVQLAVFPQKQFPYYISAIQDSPNLLISVIRHEEIQGIRRPYANILFFSAEDHAFTSFLPGQYFECSATIIGDTVFYSSLQTGRCDLWSQKTTPKNQENTLVLSNRLVKYQLSSKKKNLLFTTMDPLTPTDQKIWIAQADQNYLSTPHELCSGEQPNWIRKGHLIVYQRQNYKATAPQDWFPNTTIWTIKPDGSLKKRLTPKDANYADKNPVWTMDGKHIIFASNRNCSSPNGFNLWMMDADGNHQRQLTHSSATDDFPVPTPDGKAVIFRSNRDLQWGLWKLALPN